MVFAMSHLRISLNRPVDPSTGMAMQREGQGHCLRRRPHGAAHRGQPVPQFCFHRPLTTLFGLGFAAGFVVDGFDRPRAQQRRNHVGGAGAPPLLTHALTRSAAQRKPIEPLRRPPDRVDAGKIPSLPGKVHARCRRAMEAGGVDPCGARTAPAWVLQS